MRTGWRRIAFVGFHLFVGLIVWFFGVLSIWSPSTIRGIEVDGNEVLLRVTTRCNAGVRVSVDETPTHVLVRFEATRGQDFDCGGAESVTIELDQPLGARKFVDIGRLVKPQNPPSELSTALWLLPALLYGVSFLGQRWPRATHIADTEDAPKAEQAVRLESPD